MSAICEFIKDTASGALDVAYVISVFLDIGFKLFLVIVFIYEISKMLIKENKERKKERKKGEDDNC